MGVTMNVIKAVYRFTNAAIQAPMITVSLFGDSTSQMAAPIGNAVYVTHLSYLETR
jgi:hypothetical protein